MQNAQTQDGNLVAKNVSIQKFKQHMSEKIHSAHKTQEDGEFQLPQVVSRQGQGVWSQEAMSQVPLLKPVQA